MVKLVFLNLFLHPLRTFLTIGALTVAIFLLCTLQSLITTLDENVEMAGTDRLVVQSAVSLYVDLPLSYQAKIDQVPGVDRSSKWHWFGGFFKEEQNQFAQFAVDPDQILQIFPEYVLKEGSQEAFVANRRGCVIGEGLVEKFGWQLGDTVPLTGMIYPHPEGSDVAWEFQVEAIYEVTQTNFDTFTMYFHWDYFEQTMKAGGLPFGVGTYVVDVAAAHEPTQVMASVDELFAGGPQVVQATSFSEFMAQFTSMLGNVPFFLRSLGGAILAAIFLASVNTMLMAANEQIRDVGVLKALGFTNATMFGLMTAQSLVLCLVGGGLGVGVAVLMQNGIAEGIAQQWPGYRVMGETIAMGLGVSLLLGIFAGIVPAWRAGRMTPIEALGATE